MARKDEVSNEIKLSIAIAFVSIIVSLLMTSISLFSTPQIIKDIVALILLCIAFFLLYWFVRFTKKYPIKQKRH